MSRPALLLLLCLGLALCLPACGDEDKSAQEAGQTSGQTGGQSSGQAAELTNGLDAGQANAASGSPPGTPENAPAKPQIRVGDLNLPMPAPQGFKRIEAKHPLYSKLKVKPGESLLGVFARTGQSAAAQIPEQASAAQSSAATGQTSAATGEVATLTDFAGNPEDFDLLLVTTLEKWLAGHFSLESFTEITAPWQKSAVPHTRDTLHYFIQAAQSRLPGTGEYTYNLGMTGAGPGQISFARVIKSSDSTGQSRYVCALNSLLYRNGKILGLHLRVRVRDLAEIGPTIENYMGYLNSLQNLDKL